MTVINIIAEGNSEENFVNEVLTPHFSKIGKFVFVRKIETGWDRRANKPAKGGFGKNHKYATLRSDILNWILSDKGRLNTYYTTFVDLYAFPIDSESPFTTTIRSIADCYAKVDALERAIASNIDHERFIPHVQLHEFETLLLVDPDKLLIMYPDCTSAVARLKREILGKNVEEINDSFHTAPSKRIINHIAEYESQKAQVGPLVAADIGLAVLRQNCPHFNKWLTNLENL